MYVIYVNGIVMVTIGLVPEITANLLDWKNCINITNSTEKTVLYIMIQYKQNYMRHIDNN